MTLISVVIPAYNRATLLPRAVASIQAQDFPDLEILIVDDGSKDNTAEVVETLQRTESRIRYVRHVVNRGEAAARNTGLAEANGELIAFLDSDDAWLPGKLQRQYELLQLAGEGTHGVATANYIVWDDGSQHLDNAWHFRKPITVRNILVHGCAIGLGLNCLLRRDAVRAAGLFDETLKLYVDVDWLCRFLARARMIAQPEPYAMYHKAPDRSGKLVEAAAAAFQRKNVEIFSALSWIDRSRAKALLWQNAALGYKAEGNRLGLARTTALALLCNPFVPIGNYVELLDAVLGTEIVKWVQRRRAELMRR
jgi:glycosyltransferase involved in cell wall biosynthesis